MKQVQSNSSSKGGSENFCGVDALRGNRKMHGYNIPKQVVIQPKDS